MCESPPVKPIALQPDLTRSRCVTHVEPFPWVVSKDMSGGRGAAIGPEGSP
jgi:hypothetical protein